MGLASKIKNASSAPSATPQLQQHAGSYEGGSATGYVYPQQALQGTGSYDRHGAVPPAHQYEYPQQEYKMPYGAPSAPPFTEPPQQYYGGGYPAPHEHPVQPHQQPHVESTPYGVQGPTPPHAVQVQPPSYGAPQDAGGKPTYMQSVSNNMLSQKLQDIIRVNRLEAFYDQRRLQATLQKVAYISFTEIAAEWKISAELAYDLAPLALYDIVFYCDDSGSMAFEENGERIDDLKFILSKVSGIATKFDDDGIRVRFMNSDVNGDGIHNAADVENLISKVRFSGMTPLGTNLDRKVIQPFVLDQAMSNNMAKPVLAIIITDGEPSGEDRGTIRQVIRRAKDGLTSTRYGGGGFAVQIAQVGKDASTQKFLESLDKDPVIGGMIDCTSYYEMEEAEFARQGVTLTPELWLLKMCVGAIDPEYDSKDH